jgi:hypothetical protein
LHVNTSAWHYEDIIKQGFAFSNTHMSGMEGCKVLTSGNDSRLRHSSGIDGEWRGRLGQLACLTGSMSMVMSHKEEAWLQHANKLLGLECSRISGWLDSDYTHIAEVLLHMRSRSIKGGRHGILTRSRSDIDGLGSGRNIHQQIGSALSDGSAWTGGDGRLDLVVKHSQKITGTTGVDRNPRRPVRMTAGCIYPRRRTCCGRHPVATGVLLQTTAAGRCTTTARPRAWRRDWSTAAAACQGHRAQGVAK